jgi:hypothetical protein
MRKAKNGTARGGAVELVSTFCAALLFFLVEMDGINHVAPLKAGATKGFV